MNKIIIYILIILIISCKNESGKVKDLEKRNAELMDSIKKLPTKSNATNFSKKTPSKKLMYLYYANAGLWAFYDDGTYTKCSQCDLSQQNIKNMHDEEPTGKYNILGARLVTESNEFSFDEGNSWAMIYYEWKISINE